jgi:aspartyl protease family protein
MRSIIIFAGMLLGLGVVVARMADQAGRTPAVPPASAALAAVPPAPPSSYGTSVTVPRDARGHFVVDARVDGRHMTFMLDTGASLIALRARDAAALGIHPVVRDFTDALSENLLGLSFLSRLRRFEYSNGKIVLEQ